MSRLTMTAFVTLDGIMQAPGGPLNRLPKYVASRTLDRLEWSGSVLVRDVRTEVARLKAKDGPEIQVHGSPGLAQTLLAHGLIDELYLLEFPVVLGTGKRLFGSGTQPTAFEVTSTQTTSRGVVIRTLHPAGRPVLGAAPPPQ